jgi:hypothetical protein
MTDGVSARVFRHVVVRRLESLFKTGGIVLDLASKSEEGIRLLRRGIDVRGRDEVTSLVRADGAFAGLGVLDGADLPAVGAILKDHLRSNAIVVLCLSGFRPLRLLVQRAFTGRQTQSPCPSLSESMVLLGDSLHWHDVFPLGVLLPDSAPDGWIEAHPQTFGVLAGIERLVRDARLLRTFGDYMVIEGRRR